MKVTINKCEPKGTIEAPPSKSMAHRLLISAGLANGRSVVHSVALSQDILATIDCLKALGAGITIDGNTVTIDGIGKPQTASETLKCRESGSTLRFFLPLCMLSENEKTLCGSETLLHRPLSIYEDICKAHGIKFLKKSNQITVGGKLTPGEYTVQGNISSQFITGLMFALPLLNGDSKINIIPPIESMSYIKMTIDALRTFGVTVDIFNENTLIIKGNQQYKPQEVFVEGDYSNSAFFSAMNYLGGNVNITGLKKDSLQGDKVYEQLFALLKNGAPKIDISDCPDLGPILMALAAAKNGATFVGTKRLKIKESDRRAAMAEELKKFGVTVTVEENQITVTPENFLKPSEVLYGHNDHRIVMALSVLLLLVGGSIDGAQAVNKSMPDFFNKLAELGVVFNCETI